ncbi:SAM-dependent methyltransferase [Nonomuraea ceibae]|uniref:SAM-dependent methyltransferase n=1 Tax=Nonomuraea ceibae TaxID=1935170 RepID=UPI001C5FCB3C|nr:class I SAM-dependent methyltransferase [Nonomuraea ceibae]
MAVPERLAWAVDTLDIQAGERILEIGCGRGVAVELACDAGATVTAIDRSATMIEAARQRNAHHVAAGRAILRTAALADADLPEGAFGKVFAVNVNVFWTGVPARELDVIRRALAPGGTLFLFYEPPGAARRDDLLGRLRLDGFATEVLTGGDTLLCVRARPEGQVSA